MHPPLSRWQQLNGIARSMAINLLLAVPVMRRLVTVKHVTGIDGDEAQARQLLNFFEGMADIKDAVVLELGPGKTLETLQFARERGAKYVIAADIINYHSPESAHRRGVDYRLFDGVRLPVPQEAHDKVCRAIRDNRSSLRDIAELIEHEAAGRVVLVEKDPRFLPLLAELDDGSGRLVVVDTPAEATVRGTVTDLLLLAGRLEDADTLFFQRRLVLTGDTELGLTARNLLDRLPWERVPLGLRIALNRGARFAEAARAAYRTRT